MPYSLTILWCERNRFLPAILAVTFSALLIALQCGMLFGFLAATARPINHSRADLWVGSKGMPGLGFSEPVPEDWRGRLKSQPEVEWTEPFLYGVGVWRRPTGGTETCYIVGSRLGSKSIGALPELSPQLRSRLSVPGSVVVDTSGLGPLGLEKGEGEVTEVFKQRVRVVGVMQGGGTGLIPAVYCSLETARMLLPGVREKPEQANYLLARCHSPEEAQTVARRLSRQYPQMATYTREQFASLTGLHWLTNTKAGIALGFAALLGFIVGAVITSQTLFAAVVASLKEYAVLRALGIPRWRIALLVLVQSLWIGVIGVSIAVPAALGVSHMVKQWWDIDVILSAPLLSVTASLTVVMALVSGVTALRSLKQAEPIVLLR